MSRTEISNRLELTVAQEWSRLGALFNVLPASQTPDIEQLLLNTARVAAKNSRLLVMAATWLSFYGNYVAKRRLAVLVRESLEPEFRPILGFLLEWVTKNSPNGSHRFREAIAQCRPDPHPRPMLAVSARSKVLIDLAASRASPLSKKWGRWLNPFDPKPEALRPIEWIAAHNPSLALRALCGGDLVATIAADAAGGLDAFSSESQLARRYGASRASIRDALKKLKMAGYASQSTDGKSRPIRVNLSPS